MNLATLMAICLERNEKEVSKSYWFDWMDAQEAIDSKYLPYEPSVAKDWFLEKFELVANGDAEYFNDLSNTFVISNMVTLESYRVECAHPSWGEDGIDSCFENCIIYNEDEKKVSFKSL